MDDSAMEATMIHNLLVVTELQAGCVDKSPRCTARGEGLASSEEVRYHWTGVPSPLVATRHARAVAGSN